VKYQEALDFALKARHIKVWVNLNAHEGVYMDIPKEEFIKTLKKSKNMLEGYGEVDAYRNGRTLVVG